MGLAYLLRSAGIAKSVCFGHKLKPPIKWFLNLEIKVYHAQDEHIGRMTKFGKLFHAS
jgi:hypothetical protein